MADASGSAHGTKSPAGAASDPLFAIVCAVLYCAAIELRPPYYPMIQPDSVEYLEFSYLRTSIYPLFLRGLQHLGLTPLQITHVQLALFGVTLGILLVALRRSSVPRWMAAAVTVALMNPLFAGYHRTILTESLFASTTVLALAAWLEYARTARTGYLAIVSLAVGLLIGIRPAALGLAPAVLVSWWMYAPRRRAAAIAALAAAVVPLVAAATAERVVYKVAQSGRAIMTPYGYLPNTMAAEAAMIVAPGMSFAGPHARALDEVSRKIIDMYGPAQRFVAGVPTLAGRANVEAVFEVTAIAIAVDDLFQRAAASAATTPAQLRLEFAEQVIAQNVSGFGRLVLLHYVGQWAVVAPNFPPIARAIGAYTEQFGPIPLSAYIPQDAVKPRSSLYSAAIFPAFAAMGAITLIMSFALVWYVFRPPHRDAEWLRFFEAAALFSFMCQTYVVSISIITVAQPRYLMAVYPQLVLIAALSSLWLWQRWIRTD